MSYRTREMKKINFQGIFFTFPFISVDQCPTIWVELIISIYMQDEVFSSCRFAESNDKNQVLYIAAVTGDIQT